jgi:hypothetical protein
LKDFRVLPPGEHPTIILAKIFGINEDYIKTQTAAYPSPTDIESAVLSGPIYFIVSLKNQDQPVIRGFRILEGKVIETELRTN